MRCALIGVTGQLGHDLARTFDLPGELVRLTRADLDLLAPGAVGRVLREIRPTHVVNCAAYNLVDRAEDERDVAFAVNAEGSPRATSFANDGPLNAAIRSTPLASVATSVMRL